MSKSTFIVTRPNYWGKGETLAEAFNRCQMPRDAGVHITITNSETVTVNDIDGGIGTKIGSFTATTGLMACAIPKDACIDKWSEELSNGAKLLESRLKETTAHADASDELSAAKRDLAKAIGLLEEVAASLSIVVSYEDEE